MNNQLTFEMGRYDKIASWVEYVTRTIFPPLVEKDGAIFIQFSDGTRYTIKDRYDSEDVAVVRLSVLNDTTIETIEFIMG